MRHTLAVLSVCLLPILGQANETRTKADLAAVQAELKKSQAAYQQQQASFSALKSTLQSFELEIAKSAKALAFTEQGISENKQQQYTLQREAEQLELQKKRLQRLLAAQLKSAYVTGSHDYSKMLLNQQHAAALERTISYYDYFNQARIAQLEALKSVFAKLAENRAQLERKKKQLLALQDQQTARRDELMLAQNARKTHLNKLNDKLSQAKAAIAYLEENEQTLISTLETLASEQASSPEQYVAQLQGLQRLKGKLAWPLDGRLKHRFGQRKHVGMNWKGVVIRGSNGTPVNSVAPGQVVYADWLNGFGWVIVLDHGEGFMSLYGHAQTLLKDVGDQVMPGEPIALVGQSGGQTDPGLYFEIRHKGSAVDPVKWCRSS
ncbi:MULTISPECIES: peptidoglycan DD-metalloendopeptidase family protein [Pseudoalteromonas]|uniref:Peptidoglycan DD-metalloendopeptidase family protein n=1 Tax=Pseudoalteromonas rubra TaxID=43658 RepID=A0A5S3UVE1_9GAMM|nr:MULTISPECIES: peptidoglycan DD-metalloendopeptidase family protein [Pseudoalteromonas]MCG7562731.1 peptidoglycan DD-metalloendopeptidase family protein [Pseudoalteromonas sp. McH1-42]MEC4090962.1 peptidoglycan DD-metalloendopeptidase family protein [Pseudoalteromonas rubra]QPB84529.1 peptidoglycan DD-metalloendopeptidase family protein [Pseudoalteromonas rubra]